MSDLDKKRMLGYAHSKVSHSHYDWSFESYQQWGSWSGVYLFCFLTDICKINILLIASNLKQNVELPLKTISEVR